MNFQTNIPIDQVTWCLVIYIYDWDKKTWLFFWGLKNRLFYNTSHVIFYNYKTVPIYCYVM